MDKLNAILKRVNYRDNETDVLVSAMEQVIFAGEKALEALEQAYGE